MVSSKSGASLLPLLAFVLALLVSSEAQARRGVMIVNTGEDVMKIADIPEPTLAELAAAGVSGRPEIGVMYSRFGVFWLDIVRWNPQYVVFVDDGVSGFEYETASPAQLAELAGVPEAEITKPIRYYLPPGAVILGLLVFVGGPLYLFSSVASRRRRAALMNDPRYQTAVAKYHGNWEIPADERLAASVAVLTGEGVSEREARNNLVFLCGIEDQDS
jgi:hypothetical protein